MSSNDGIVAEERGSSRWRKHHTLLTALVLSEDDELDALAEELGHACVGKGRLRSARSLARQVLEGLLSGRNEDWVSLEVAVAAARAAVRATQPRPVTSGIRPVVGPRPSADQTSRPDTEPPSTVPPDTMPPSTEPAPTELEPDPASTITETTLPAVGPPSFPHEPLPTTRPSRRRRPMPGEPDPLGPTLPSPVPPTPRGTPSPTKPKVLPLRPPEPAVPDGLPLRPAAHLLDDTATELAALPMPVERYAALTAMSEHAYREQRTQLLAAFGMRADVDRVGLDAIYAGTFRRRPSLRRRFARALHQWRAMLAGRRGHR